jgi:hypothetical protein
MSRQKILNKIAESISRIWSTLNVSKMLFWFATAIPIFPNFICPYKEPLSIKLRMSD